MHYVVGDIHGHLPRFESILHQIHPSPQDTVYFLGDVIDRNPDGLLILSRIMDMANAEMILGNHEYMMLHALTESNTAARIHAMELWYSNGGQVTHLAWKRYSSQMQEAFLRYIDELPLNIDLSVNGTNFLLVHGAPEIWYQNRLSRYRSRKEFAVWERITIQDTAPDGRAVIFGHTPTQMYQHEVPPKIWKQNNFIGIDCGCAFDGGRLACLRLEDMSVFYSADGI